MYRWKNRFLLLFLLLISKAIWAQPAATPEKSDGFMRSEGKIYVVVVVVITILAGLLYYLVRLDRKISKLEKEKN